MTVPVVLDTDGGTDDAVALWWALTDPRVELRGDPRHVGQRRPRRRRRHLPPRARRRRARRRARRPRRRRAPGADAAAGTGHLRARRGRARRHRSRLAHRRRADRSTSPRPSCSTASPHERPGEIVLVTIGPLSTTAAALRKEPSIAGRVRDLDRDGRRRRPEGQRPARRRGEHRPRPRRRRRGGRGGVAVATAARRPRRDARRPARRRACSTSPTRVARRRPRMLAGPLRAYADVLRPHRADGAGHVPVPRPPRRHRRRRPRRHHRGARRCRSPSTPGESAAWGATVADLRPRPEGTPEGFHPWRVAPRRRRRPLPRRGGPAVRRLRGHARQTRGRLPSVISGRVRTTTCHGSRRMAAQEGSSGPSQMPSTAGS